MNSKTYKRLMAKTAGVGQLIPTMTDVTTAVTDLGMLASAYLVAAATIGGMTAGGLTAKITSPGKSDMDTARKSYENERLKADIGYLKARLKQESDAANKVNEVKPMRVF